MKKFINSALLIVLLLSPLYFVNADLGNRLSGKILLQVESVGQSWYVDPGTKQRAFLGRPADAFRIMRELGLGVSENDYNSFNGVAPSKLSGKILLRVEANGEAYYVYPDDLKLYYLGRPTDAFQIMREKGLGITDEDLGEVPVFQKYKEQVNKGAEKLDNSTEESVNQEEIIEQSQQQVVETRDQEQELGSESSTESESEPEPEPESSTEPESEPESESTVDYSDYILNYSMHKNDEDRYVIEFSNDQNATRDITIKEVIVKVENSESGEVGWVQIQTPSVTTAMDNININEQKYRYNTPFEINFWKTGSNEVKFYLGSQSSTATIDLLLDEWVIWDDTVNKQIQAQQIEYVAPPAVVKELIVNPVELGEIEVNESDTGVIIYQADIKMKNYNSIIIKELSFECSDESFDFSNIKNLYLYISGLAKTRINPTSFSFSSLSASARILNGTDVLDKYVYHDAAITVKADFSDYFSASSTFSLYLNDESAIAAVDDNNHAIGIESETNISIPSRVIDLVK